MSMPYPQLLKALFVASAIFHLLRDLITIVLVLVATTKNERGRDGDGKISG